MIRPRIIVASLAIFHASNAFQPSTPITRRTQHSSIKHTAIYALQTEEETKQSTSESKPTVEETTQKYGLEAGLFQSLQSSDTTSAKSLLAKYGIAYLATSIPLALISFAICYALVDSGVDVGALLEKVGIHAGDTGEKAGTFAIAYAAHKAASPIRFPPTVALTPVVAKLIGKEVDEE
jgi:hypothetical protein